MTCVVKLARAKIAEKKAAKAVLDADNARAIERQDVREKKKARPCGLWPACASLWVMGDDWSTCLNLCFVLVLGHVWRHMLN